MKWTYTRLLPRSPSCSADYLGIFEKLGFWLLVIKTQSLNHSIKPKCEHTWRGLNSVSMTYFKIDQADFPVGSIDTASSIFLRGFTRWICHPATRLASGEGSLGGRRNFRLWYFGTCISNDFGYWLRKLSYWNFGWRRWDCKSHSYAQHHRKDHESPKNDHGVRHGSAFPNVSWRACFKLLGQM